MRTECDWLVDAVVGRGEGGGDELLEVDLEEGVEVLGERLPSLLYHVFLRRQSVRRILLYHVTHQVLQIGCIYIFLIQRYFFWKCCRWYLNYPSTRLHFEKQMSHNKYPVFNCYSSFWKCEHETFKTDISFWVDESHQNMFMHMTLSLICYWPWPIYVFDLDLEPLWHALLNLPWCSCHQFFQGPSKGCTLHFCRPVTERNQTEGFPQ